MALRVALISANRHKEPYPVYPLGVAYLKSYLGKNIPDVEVDVIDMNLTSEEALRLYLEECNPDYVGMSIRNIDGANSLDARSFIPEYRQTAEIVRASSGAPIILGGAGFSIFPELLIRELKADYGVVGEGEGPLSELILMLERGGSPDNIPSVIRGDMKRSEGTRCYISSTEASFDPLLAEYYWKNSGMLNIQTKRGCPYNCIYCTYPSIDGRKVRTMDIDSLIGNIAKAKRDHGADYLFFTDSVFNIDDDYNAQLAESLIRSGVNISWGAYFTPSRLTNEQMKLYKASGLTHIEFGTESFSDRTLSAYGKRFTFEDVVTASELALKHNVYYAHFLILGGWGETSDTLRETMENSRKLRHTVFFPYVGMRIYPDTPLHGYAIKAGSVEAADDLVDPKYYLSPGFDLAEAKHLAAQTGKAWIFPDDPVDETMNTLKFKRNKKGPLWEYLRKP